MLQRLSILHGSYNGLVCIHVSFHFVFNSSFLSCSSCSEVTSSMSQTCVVPPLQPPYYSLMDDSERLLSVSLFTSI